MIVCIVEHVQRRWALNGRLAPRLSQAGWLSVKLASEWTWMRLWVRVG
jgi:hypothetical protein